MWVGRGDYAPRAWEDVIIHAQEQETGDDFIADKTGGMSHYMTRAIVALRL